MADQAPSALRLMDRFRADNLHRYRPVLSSLKVHIPLRSNSRRFLTRAPPFRTAKIQARPHIEGKLPVVITDTN